MANNEINIKLTADQKIERLRSGKPLYVESALDTSGGKHEYVIKDEDIKKFLANQKVERLSATQITSLLQTGYSSFDEQIDALNRQLSSAVGEEKKKIQAALNDAKQLKYFSERKSPIGSAVHKMLELQQKQFIDFNKEEESLEKLYKEVNLHKGAMPELEGIVRASEGQTKQMFKAAFSAAREMAKMRAAAGMIGGGAEEARSAIIRRNDKYYLISGTTDWASGNRIGDYKTTTEFKPIYNQIQTAVNAWLTNLQTGKNEQITGSIIHYPLTYTGAQKYGVLPSVYGINPGTPAETNALIEQALSVKEGTLSPREVKIPGRYYITSSQAQSGKYAGRQWGGRYMGQWLKETPDIVEDAIAHMDPVSKVQFIRALFSSGDSGYYRTGNTAEALRNKYAKSYFSEASLSRMQKAWSQGQYQNIIADVIERKAEQDPGIIYGLVYGNRDYGSISDDFYNWVSNSSQKTARYLDLVSGMGELGSGQTPTEDEKKWLDQGRSKAQQWQPDVFELAESADLARLEQADSEIREGPTSRDIQKTANEVASFILDYFKIIDLFDKYMKDNAIDEKDVDKVELIKTFLAQRETAGDYKGGYEKFMTTKHFYDELFGDKNDKVMDAREILEEAQANFAQNGTAENQAAVVEAQKRLEEAMVDARTVSLKEVVSLMADDVSSFAEAVPEREKKVFNKIAYYKEQGYGSEIERIFADRIRNFARTGRTFTYSSDINKLLEPAQNIEEYVFESDKSKTAKQIEKLQDENIKHQEERALYKQYLADIDKTTPGVTEEGSLYKIQTEKEYDVDRIMQIIQQNFLGKRVHSTLIDKPQIDKIRKLLLDNFDTGMGDFIEEVGNAMPMYAEDIFRSPVFANIDETLEDEYTKYSEEAMRAREQDISWEAETDSEWKVAQEWDRLQTLRDRSAGVETFLQKEIKERADKEQEFTTRGTDWWYALRTPYGKERWFKTSADMGAYAKQIEEGIAPRVRGMMGNKAYFGTLTQATQTRPWSTFYEGEDPWKDNVDVMSLISPSAAATDFVKKNNDIAQNIGEGLSNVIADVATDVLQKDETSNVIKQEAIETTEDNLQQSVHEVDSKRAQQPTTNVKRRVSKKTSSSGGAQHVIVDGTEQGDFTNKKKVAEMWDAEGRLISYVTKEISRRSSDKSRGTPQLDVIKQIKDDTGKIVDMMAIRPPVSGGGDNLPPINEPPSGGGASSGGNGDKEGDSKKTLRSEYIKYLKERYDLLIKIDALEHKQEQTEAKKEDATGIRRDIGVLKKAELDIVSEMSSERFSGMSEDESIIKAEEVQKHRRQSKKNLLEMGDAEDALKAFERYATKRMKLESEIEQAQLKASTTVGNEKRAWENVASLKQQNLDKTKGTYNILEQQARKKVGDQRVDEITEAVKEQKAILFAQKFAGNRGNRTIFDVIKSDIQRATMRITDFGLAAKVLNTARKEIQQVYQNILKLDEAMTNLRIVTGSNTEQAKSMMNTYNDLAMQLGTTTQAVASSAAEWLRQGYSVSEANELIKSSTYLSRLGFMDMNQSVTALTSVMKGFRIEAADSMDIVDKLTQLDAKYATTAGDIATALSRTSAVAREAGLDLDQTAAALTTMIDVSQQDASSVGNAFRTILARYGNVKATAFTSLVGDSEDIDDANGSINDTEKVLGAIGIKIRSSSSDMRDFDDVMDELADKWVTLTDVEKNLKQSSIMEQSIIANPLNCWKTLIAI